MLISAQYGSNTPAGNAYGHVGIYIGDGKVMDSIYSGLRTISLVRLGFPKRKRMGCLRLSMGLALGNQKGYLL